MLYILLSNVLLISFFTFYWFGLRKFTFFQWNRYYLLGTVLLSYLIPIVLFTEVRLPGVFKISLPQIVLNGNIDSSNKLVDSSIFISENIFLWHYIYWIGVIVSSLWLLFRFALLYRKIRSGNNEESFSFFKITVLDRKLSEQQAQIVSSHEMEHAKQWHSLDIIVMELFRVFNWFNPVYGVLIQEQKFLHECFIDSKNPQDKVEYAELIISKALNTNVSQLQSFFSQKSLLKNRINMLFKPRSSKSKQALYFLLLPVCVFMLIFVINCKPDAYSYSSGGENREYVENPEFFAEFPGGIDAFREYIQIHYTYPQAAIDAGVKGKLEIGFIIGTDGIPRNFVTRKALGYGTEGALIDVIKSAGVWTPAIDEGVKVACEFTIPLYLNLRQD